MELNRIYRIINDIKPMSSKSLYLSIGLLNPIVLSILSILSEEDDYIKSIISSDNYDINILEHDLLIKGIDNFKLKHDEYYETIFGEQEGYHSIHPTIAAIRIYKINKLLQNDNKQK